MQVLDHRVPAARQVTFLFRFQQVNICPAQESVSSRLTRWNQFVSRLTLWIAARQGQMATPIRHNRYPMACRKYCQRSGGADGRGDP